MKSGNMAAWIEEIAALRSIYGNDFIEAPMPSGPHTIKIIENKNEVILDVTTTPGYPSNGPPKYEISAPWMNRKMKENLHKKLDGIYLKNEGEAVVYQWVEAIRRVILGMKSTKAKINSDNDNKRLCVREPKNSSQSNTICPKITHAEVIADRKSIFQGHAAEVHSIEEVKMVLATLKENKKIANAKHNMYAYRIEKKTPKGITIVQDCDNDGENQAGGRMLHLLQVLDQRNTVIVVTRWFGGIQIGSDRFRHINNASRQAIKDAGLLKQ